MNIFLLVVTSDREFRDYVGIQKHMVFPRDSLKKGFLADRKVRPFVNAVDVQDFQTSSQLENFIADRSGDADCLLLMIDHDKAALADDIRAAALVCEIDNERAAKNYQNFLHDRLGRLIKTISFLARHFHDGSDSVLLSLPLRNFKSSALSELKSEIADDPCSTKLLNSVEANLQLLRRRVRPRKKTGYKIKYAVDEQERFFVFGKEHHSLPGTGSPHQKYCILNAYFRFGCRIDHTRHYNVSEGESDTTQVSGQFLDCHGQVHKVKNRTHINMFSNDFF